MAITDALKAGSGALKTTASTVKNAAPGIAKSFGALSREEMNTALQGLKQGFDNLPSMNLDQKKAFLETVDDAAAHLNLDPAVNPTALKSFNDKAVALRNEVNGAGQSAGWQPSASNTTKTKQAAARENFGMNPEQAALRNKMLLGEAALSFTPAAAVTVPHMMLDSAVGVIHGALTGNMAEVGMEAIGLIPWGKSVQVLKAAGKLKEVAPLLDAALSKGHGLGVVSAELKSKVQSTATQLIRETAQKAGLLKVGADEMVGLAKKAVEEGADDLLKQGDALLDGVKDLANKGDDLVEGAKDLVAKAESLVDGTTDAAKSAGVVGDAGKQAAANAQAANTQALGGGKPSGSVKGAEEVVEHYSPQAIKGYTDEALETAVLDHTNQVSHPGRVADCLDQLASRFRAKGDPFSLKKAQGFEDSSAQWRKTAATKTEAKAAETVEKQAAINSAQSLGTKAEAALTGGDAKLASQLFEQASDAASKSLNVDTAATYAKKAAELLAKEAPDQAPRMFLRAGEGQVRQMQAWKGLPDDLLAKGKLETVDAIRNATPAAVHEGLEMFARANTPAAAKQLMATWMNKLPAKMRGDFGSQFAAATYDKVKALQSAGDVGGAKQLARTAVSAMEEIYTRGGSGQVKVKFGGEMQRWSWDEAIGSFKTLAK
jgi:hypothetical protein